MSETSIKSAQFITADQVIKDAMIDMGESSNHLYARFMSWLQRGMDELNFDVLKNLKQAYLPVDNTTQTAKLPKDFVQYTRVGIIDQGGEILDLTYDPNIAFTPIPEDCQNEHCECGCNSETCAFITNQSTTTEDIVINGTTYQKTTTICTDDEGNIKAHICTPVVTNTEQLCNYQVTILNLDNNPLVPKNLPFWNFKFKKNGQEIFVGDIQTKAVLQAVMTANGFTEDGLTLVWNITQTSDVWQSISYFDNQEHFTTATFTQSGCTTPTPSVSTVCYDEVICKTETKPCGCPVLSDEVVNTLNNWGVMFQEFIQRDLRILDWQLTLKQPLSWIGYFNISQYDNVIQFDQTYPYDTVYVQYYTAQEVDSGQFLVPIFAREALGAYIKFKYYYNKSNVSQGEKRMLQKYWLNEKKKCHERIHPLSIANEQDVERSNPRP